MTEESAAAERPDLEEVRRALQSTLSRFDAEYWREVDKARAFPTACFDAMAEAGYFGTLVPAGLGGASAGPSVAAIVVEEINRGGGDAACINAQMALCGPIIRHGSEAQRQAYLPGIASGEIRLLTVAATEPDSGADMSQLQSTGKRDGDGWLLEARKVLISLAEHTRLMILLVRTDEGPTLFLLDMEEVRASIEIQPIDLITNRLTTMLFIDGLRVSDDKRLGPVGKGVECLMKGFAVRRALAASESIGHARFLLDKSLEHAKTRNTFNRIIGENQGVQYPLAQAWGKLEAADLMRWDALRIVEEGGDATGRSALAKLLASEAAWETARAALTTFGGWGLASEYHVERKLRELTVFVFNNMLWSLVAQRVLGLPKAF